MENIKVNSNKFIKFKFFIKDTTPLGWFLTFLLLLGVFIFILALQHGVRYLFFTDSLLYKNDDLLVEYQNEVQEHNLPVFYNMASQLLKDKQDYNSLVMYKVIDNKTVQKFNLNDFPLSLKILKRHKEGHINNSVYLVDLAYVHKENNDYKLKHDNVILKTDDIYYLEYEYSPIMHVNYESDYHNAYLNRKKKESEIPDSMKKNAIKSLNEFNNMVSQQ